MKEKENKKAFQENDRSTERESGNDLSSQVGHSPTPKTGDTNLDEKSSGMGRRNKGSGLSTKDGLTGSDYDGQVTD